MASLFLRRSNTSLSMPSQMQINLKDSTSNSDSRPSTSFGTITKNFHTERNESIQTETQILRPKYSIFFI